MSILKGDKKVLTFFFCVAGVQFSRLLFLYCLIF